MQTDTAVTEFMIVMSSAPGDFDRMVFNRCSGLLNTGKRVHYFISGREVREDDYIDALLGQTLTLNDFRNGELSAERMERDKLNGILEMFGRVVHFLDGRMVSEETYKATLRNELVSIVKLYGNVQNRGFD